MDRSQRSVQEYLSAARREPGISEQEVRAIVDAGWERRVLAVPRRPWWRAILPWGAAALIVGGGATAVVMNGGEESGGLGTTLHIPERDGIFNGLLLLEMMARRGKSIGELSRELDAEFGPHRYRRVDKRMTEERKRAILKSAEKGLDAIGSYKVTGTSRLDGYKFFVDNGWMLIRASGTEPLLRFYAEGESDEMVNELLEGALAL